MNLKKNDKLILILGVAILIVAAIAIVFYTSADVNDIDVYIEPDKKTFDVTWKEMTTEKPIVKGVAQKSYSETEEISAPHSSVLTKVEFQITWNDDHTSGLLIKRGADTLTAKIGKPGAEPEKKSSTETGNMSFSFSVNDRPSDDYIEAEDANEAEEIVKEWFINENEASFDVTVNVQTGEKLGIRPLKLLRYFQDKGNNFNLKIMYTYYVLEIEEQDGDENDDVPPTALGGYDGACGEFYKNLCYGRGMI